MATAAKPVLPEEYLIRELMKYGSEDEEAARDELYRLKLYDSYHDFGGTRGDKLVVDHLNVEYEKLLGSTIFDDVRSRGISLSDIERRTQLYYYDQYPMMFDATSNGFYVHDVPYSYLKNAGAEIPVQQKNILLIDDEADLSADAYSAIGRKLVRFLFQEDGDIDRVGICIDANPGNMPDLISNLLDKPYAYQAITPQNILDSAVTGFSVLSKDKRDKSRTEFIFPSDTNMITQSSNILTREYITFNINKANYDSDNTYGFVWEVTYDNSTTPLYLNQTEKDGPSVTLLTKYFSANCNKLNGVQQRSICYRNVRKDENQHVEASLNRQINMMGILNRINDPTLYKNTCIDIKRLGDHEQAHAVYWMNRNGQRCIFVTGDILSGLYSRMIGNPTVYVSSSRNALECFSARTTQSERGILNDKVRNMALVINDISINYTLLQSILNRDGAFSKLRANIVSKLLNPSFNPVKTSPTLKGTLRDIFSFFVKLRAWDILLFLQFVERSALTLLNDILAAQQNAIEIFKELIVIYDNAEIQRIEGQIEEEKRAIQGLGGEGAEATQGKLIEIKHYFTYLQKIMNKLSSIITSNGEINQSVVSFIGQQYDILSTELRRTSGTRLLKTVNNHLNANGEFDSTYTNFFNDNNTVIKLHTQFDFNIQSVYNIVSQFNKVMTPSRGRSSEQKDTISELHDTILQYTGPFSILNLLHAGALGPSSAEILNQMPTDSFFSMLYPQRQNTYDASWIPDYLKNATTYIDKYIQLISSINPLRTFAGGDIKGSTLVEPRLHMMDESANISSEHVLDISISTPTGIFRLRPPTEDYFARVGEEMRSGFNTVTGTLKSLFTDYKDELSSEDAVAYEDLLRKVFASPDASSSAPLQLPLTLIPQNYIKKAFAKTRRNRRGYVQSGGTLTSMQIKKNRIANALYSMCDSLYTQLYGVDNTKENGIVLTNSFDRIADMYIGEHFNAMYFDENSDEDSPEEPRTFPEAEMLYSFFTHQPAQLGEDYNLYYMSLVSVLFDFFRDNYTPQKKSLRSEPYSLVFDNTRRIDYTNVQRILKDIIFPRWFARVGAGIVGIHPVSGAFINRAGGQVHDNNTIIINKNGDTVDTSGIIVPQILNTTPLSSLSVYAPYDAAPVASVVSDDVEMEGGRRRNTRKRKQKRGKLVKALTQLRRGTRHRLPVQAE